MAEGLKNTGVEQSGSLIKAPIISLERLKQSKVIRGGLAFLLGTFLGVADERFGKERMIQQSTHTSVSAALLNHFDPDGKIRHDLKDDVNQVSNFSSEWWDASAWNTRSSKLKKQQKELMQQNQERLDELVIYLKEATVQEKVNKPDIIKSFNETIKLKRLLAEESLDLNLINPGESFRDLDSILSEPVVDFCRKLIEEEKSDDKLASVDKY